jgi:hypothetical protein
VITAAGANDEHPKGVTVARLTVARPFTRRRKIVIHTAQLRMFFAATRHHLVELRLVICEEFTMRDFDAVFPGLFLTACVIALVVMTFKGMLH